MGKPIIPRIERGRLYYQSADVLFPIFVQATTVRAAAEAHRLDTTARVGASRVMVLRVTARRSSSKDGAR